jgi:HTH-type transcriptional regulator/antitoxin MqsA
MNFPTGYSQLPTKATRQVCKEVEFDYDDDSAERHADASDQLSIDARAIIAAEMKRIRRKLHLLAEIQALDTGEDLNRLRMAKDEQPLAAQSCA